MFPIRRYGAYIGFNADNNIVTQSTLMSNAANYGALYLTRLISQALTLSFLSIRR